MGERTANLSSIIDARGAGSKRYRAIATAVAALRRGELVAMPTETVYGLAADACNARAVGKIFIAKGRPRFNPLILHVASAAAAGELGVFNEDANRLAEAFWPGPLTLVLPMRPHTLVSDLATAGLPTVALRVPAHPVAKALLATFGGPVAAPSANLSGRVSATTAAHVAADVGLAVSAILDVGPTAIGLESTIVGLAGPEPVLLRAGAIPRDKIEAVLGRPLGAPGDDPNAPQAPGMLASHYAPAASLRLNATSVEPGEALIAFGPSLPEGAENAVATVNLSETGNLAEAATKFFAALRDLDRQAKAIAVMAIPEKGLGEAINDRLRRAAAPR
ncbi:MAG: L-threonylcarbamoyladenylate synthase [Bauldia sp.]|nr:L-threonylcarbamoyladenylate synthase [Bauldia sp.]